MNDSDKTDRIDWSDNRWKEMLVEQRKFLWRPGVIARLAEWMRLRQGMVAVDVGCGLGFLGHTYWPHFGKGGHYVGIDQSEQLLRDAAKGARQWATGGTAEFVSGDAYSLPLPDAYADWVMCQTLLMHLDDPERALREMIRVLKPGGLILCKEPDNLSGILARQYLSAADFSDDDYLLAAKVQLAIHNGHKKLGRGDQGIGNRVGHLLATLGLADVGVRIKESSYFLEPPYADEQQQHKLAQLRRHYLSARTDDYWKSLGREEFLAGGGEIEDYEKYWAIMNRFFDRAVKEIDAQRFSACGAQLFYIVKAHKPM